MPGFGSVGAIAAAQDGGAQRISTWRKTPSVVTGAGFWFDLSMSSGNPVPNYYAAAPLVSQRMAQSTDGGIYHGGPVAPARKVLRSLMVLSVTASAVPLPLVLCDYLMFYPFIDEAEPGEQAMSNTVALPRYADGAGVQAMAVVVAGQVGGQSISLRYTNQDGVADRISPSVTTGTQAVNGTILTTAAGATPGMAGPFLPLAAGDTGIRSIEGGTTSGGDVGLFTLVLVRPIASLCLRGIDAPTERDFLLEAAQCPAVADDAYLNFICQPRGSLSGAPLHGMATFAWG